MLTDIEIAQSCVMQPIEKIADTLGLRPICWNLTAAIRKGGLLCFEGSSAERQAGASHSHQSDPGWRSKTTVSIGLADALRLEGYNACLALREPSLGPVFGVKGGAAGGGYAQVVPMEDINLHFTATCTPSRRRTT